MQCPVCNDKTLVMSERQGIEIDYCPGCRGVWLDRGELDKIIERSASPAVDARAQAPAATAQPAHDPRYDRHHGQHGDSRYPKRRKSFLEELFD